MWLRQLQIKLSPRRKRGVLLKGKRVFSDSLFVILGAAVYSAAVNMFAVPNSIVQGGFTGLATMLNHLVPAMPVGLSIFLFNVPLFVLAGFMIGKRFVIRTIFVTAFFTLVIDALSPFTPHYTGDTLLAALFCGVLSGAGLGLVLLAGATTGGTELAATLVRKKRPLASMGSLMLIFDLVVIALSWAVFGKIESIMYAAVTLFVSSKTIDLVLYGADHSKLLFIITSKEKAIIEKITRQAGRGVTALNVTGGYTGKEKTLLLCAARASEASLISRMIRETDKDSFTIITEAGEVFGTGFRL